MKKLLSIVLALIITLSAFSGLSFAVFAEDAGTLAVTVNGVTTNVAVGDKFTYTYTLSDVDILNAEVRINYDSKMVAPTVVDDSDPGYKDYLKEVFPYLYFFVVCNTDRTDKILYNFSTTEGLTFTGELVVAKFEFTALAAGETTISTEVIEMVDSNQDYYVDKTAEGSVKMKDFTYGEFVTYEAPEKPTDPPTEAPTEPVKAEKVENITVTADQATATLKWDATEGAVKYWIYRYNNDTAKYECIGSSSTNSYVVKYLNPDTEYKFKVCYSDADSIVSALAKADEVAVKTLKGADVETIVGTAGLVDAVLEWSPVEGAVKYWVYKAWEENGPFYCYSSAYDTTCTVRGLQAGSDYFFKVISVTESNGSLVLSKLADAPVVRVETDAADKITVQLDSYTKSSATIHWPAFQNADKYWVRYSTTSKNTADDSHWTTWSSTTDTSYTIKYLKPNTVYYLNICARYTNEDGNVATVNYIPVMVRTAYADENVITFTPVDDTHVTLTWSEDITNVSKTWAGIIKEDGTETIITSTTTNTVTLRVADYENATFFLKVIDDEGRVGYLTPTGGEKYHN